MSTVDVVYISVGVDENQLGSTLRDATAGLVNEEPDLSNPLGFASGYRITNKKQILIDDNTHFITSVFALDLMAITNTNQPLTTLKGFGAPDLQVLAYTNTSGPNYYPSLAVLDVGATLYGGGTAAGRRVVLPWGDENFVFGNLKGDGRRLLLRSILWAAGREDYEVPVGGSPGGGPPGGGPN